MKKNKIIKEYSLYVRVTVCYRSNEPFSLRPPFVGLIVYGVLLISVIAAVRGRKAPYAISPIRIKKWYESMTVAPSLKMKGELGKIKEKPSPKDESY